MTKTTQPVRCQWCGDDEDYQHYHDQTWGRPVYDSVELFAKLCLDGQQAGLSWITILRKQQNYYQAYAQFQPQKIALFDQQDCERLMQNKGIVRNKLKINSIVKNAKGYLAIEAQGGTFSDYIWSFVGGKTIVNQHASSKDIPTESLESQAMSKALKKAGFSFVGPTICYAFMQAVGMINDHVVGCHVYQDCVELARV
ncbi:MULTISPECIES: DNA-3-methyladenine glycosylase I [unclassified Agarivorans]|uniref:DNA-3-methyladenine glycosylase I n=1 Tax=unclassified Agarivorans TaxID=2636026 RepID=UPI0026E466D0|nr:MULTISPECIES: DNA-3-methyladenine glycosylase I [unclassified Agarivorans]MDO6686710.1 DNA-3-methyladenine glycosylase I [Agarivorans sp. 3_MG-2023]MDO6716560.1 DNA-3-methyladenine glycosylase I [Agarivorans sp. 2_MG-2023]